MYDNILVLMASYLLDEPVVSRWHSLSLLWSWKRTQRHEQRQINQRSHRLIFSIEITSLTLFLWSSAALHAFIISLSLSVWMTRSGDRPHWPLLSPTSSLSNDLPIPSFHPRWILLFLHPLDFRERSFFL